MNANGPRPARLWDFTQLLTSNIAKARFRRLTVAVGLVIFASASAKADITVTGDVVTNVPACDEVNLMVGYSEGSATLTVDGGSLLDGPALQNQGTCNPGLGTVFLGYTATSSQNRAVVTGVGSLLECSWVGVGQYGSSNSFTISAGGGVNGGGFVIGANGSYNEVLVTDPGSYVSGGSISIGASLSNRFTLQNGAVVTTTGNSAGLFNGGVGTVVTLQDPGTAWYAKALLFGGVNGASNGLFVIRNGAVMDVANTGGLSGLDGDNNTLVVSNAGSLLNIHASLSTGDQWSGHSTTRIIVASGGALAAESVSTYSSAPGYSIVVDNASFFVTNSSGTGVIELLGGLTNSGLVVADQILCAPYSGGPAEFGAISFLSGTIMTKSMSYSNGSPFTVGDGSTNPANYVMQGGTHSFGDGLVVSSNGIVSGCGTITGRVTNYGLIILTNGCDMTFSGPVVNFGTILGLNGSVNFQSTFLNYGTFFQNTARVTGLSFSGNDVLVQFSTVSNYLHDVQGRNDLTTGSWASLANGLAGTGGLMSITDPGGATNGQRFYRVLLHY